MEAVKQLAVTLFLVFAPALVGYRIGERKARRWGVLYGLAGSWVGVVVLALLPDYRGSRPLERR